jgi:hypothetical protein
VLNSALTPKKTPKITINSPGTCDRADRTRRSLRRSRAWCRYAECNLASDGKLVELDRIQHSLEVRLMGELE